MDFSKVTDIEIPEGKVVEIEDNEGRVLWSALSDPNEYAYGIRWDHTVPESQATTACERIGNLELHKTLPIQSKFATCIHQGTDIKYWCDPNDSRFRKDNTGFRIVNERIYLEKTTDAEKNAVSSDYSPSATYDYTIQFPEDILNKYEEAKLLVTTYKYLYAWIKINDVNIARVNKVDTVNKKAYITTDGLITGEAIVPTLEFGCSINGYDGEISVYTPKFYIWSVDKGGAGNEVWISEERCASYARKVKAHLIGISRCALLRTAMKDDKWGWLNTLSNETAVSVVNYQPNLRGGSDFYVERYSHYLGDNNFRTMFGKAVTYLSPYDIREYTKKIKGSQVLYYQIWNAIVWCYFIEYADFNVKKPFTNNLTDEGYHQGGLGEGVDNLINYNDYNGTSSIVPIDYTLNAGNNSCSMTIPAHSFQLKSRNNSTWRNWNMADRDFGVISTIDSANDNILNITRLSNISVDIVSTDWGAVGGTHRYKIEGLTGGQTITFYDGYHTSSPAVATITKDGEYDVNWGSIKSTDSRRSIKAKLVQKSCNIKITILNAPSFTYKTLDQVQFNVPCYRGFNTFWYGDIWMFIENFLSIYDSTSRKRKFYFTDNPNNFSNDTNDKEIVIDVDVVGNNWAKNIIVGQTANLITNKTSNNANYMHSYRSDDSSTSLKYTIVGGSAASSRCGLVSLNFTSPTYNAYTNVGFVKCYIID